MRASSRIGSLTKGKQPVWSFDMQGMSMFWLAKAEELDRIARLGVQAIREDEAELRRYLAAPDRAALPSRPSAWSVAFFLAATAIENLLKAVLVIEHPETVSDGKLRGQVINSHKLCDIAVAAGLRLNDDETALCELGTEAIRTFGRYNIGKNVSDTVTALRLSIHAFAVYDGLFNRLRDRIKAAPWKRKRTQVQSQE